MRGYFTFIIVFASVFALLYLLQSFSGGANYSEEIAIEKAYQLQLNAKETVFEAARQGAREGLIEYALLNEGKYDLEEARKMARKRAFEKIAGLSGWEFEPGFEVKIWCGYVQNGELKDLKGKMLGQKGVALCENCEEIGSQKCGEFVNIDLDANNEIADVWLGANNPSNPLQTGVVGVSVYSGKFGISGTGYIPQSEKGGII